MMTAEEIVSNLNALTEKLIANTESTPFIEVNPNTPLGEELYKNAHRNTQRKTKRIIAHN